MQPQALCLRMRLTFQVGAKGLSLVGSDPFFSVFHYCPTVDRTGLSDYNFVLEKEKSFSLPNRHSALDTLRRTLQDIAEEWSMPDGDISDWNLMLDEIISNIIAYGYGDGSDHLIQVRFSRGGEQVQAEIEDDGRPFNPLDIPPADTATPLEERQAGGLGFHFVRALSDGLAYRRDAGKNVLTVTKKLRAEGGPA